ncbi:MAG: hypothetical protein LBJ64_05985 [Deltaproteobacteria bacterium]|jgi:hypothetical protein|nr:hypothetical protein [Deltaproteobacteria bacterium]
MAGLGWIEFLRVNFGREASRQLDRERVVKRIWAVAEKAERLNGTVFRFWFDAETLFFAVVV